ncbi:MAG: efflux RND transporter periplasmic adaptor subunit [Lachnospiraceae bacterium]|nr:efflux RND transporter periplasmic adaptor subunit [Lachnospiraceae bacterium]
MNEQLGNNNLPNESESKSKKNVGGKIVYFAVILAIIAAAGFMVYKRLTFKKPEDFNAVPSVNVTHIRKGSLTKEISVMGNILPTDTYYVVAKVGGDIKNIYVKNGDFVKKGDPICDIDASKEIEAAFIQYDTARSSYERMQKLYQAGDISLQSFESVKAQYDGYKLAYDTKVEYSTPVAVDDGVVENTNMTVNTSINQGTVLCYITSEGAKEINFGVTERVLSGLKLNDPVKIEKSGKVYDGYISNISNLINAQTGLFNVKAVISSENNFASGIMAKVTLPYIKKKNINLLPNEIIYYEASMPFVYVVNNDGLVNKKYIEVGIENENYTEVITNLDKSLKIVSTWNNDLAEGTTVNVVKDEKVEDEIEIESIANEIIKERNSRIIASVSDIKEESISTMSNSVKMPEVE